MTDTKPMNDQELRARLTELIGAATAHVDFDRVVADVPVSVQGAQPEGLPYSLWQLLEHIRIAQHDILDYCRNPDYQQPDWPDDYWPQVQTPPDADAWDRSVDEYKTDRLELIKAVNDPDLDLFATVASGTEHTWLRELLLVADHSAYHLGEMVTVRRLLGVWE